MNINQQRVAGLALSVWANKDFYEMYSLYLDYMDVHHKGERLCKEDSIVWASKQGLITDNEAAIFYSLL